MIEVVPASVRHIGPLSRNMREIDELECRVFGRSPKEALRVGMRVSVQPMTALIDGVPACMFGVAPVSIIDGHGRPWLLGTEAMERHGLALCVGANRYLARVSQLFARLDNWVATENTQAVRWLTRLGFTLGETRKFAGVEMQHFERRAGDV